MRSSSRRRSRARSRSGSAPWRASATRWCATRSGRRTRRGDALVAVDARGRVVAANDAAGAPAGWWRRERSPAPRARGSPRRSRSSAAELDARRPHRDARGSDLRRVAGTVRGRARRRDPPRRLVAAPAARGARRARAPSPPLRLRSIQGESEPLRRAHRARADRRRAAICPSSSPASRGRGRSCSRAPSTPQEAGAAARSSG